MTTFYSRFQSGSLKYDATERRYGESGHSPLPMWVADMDVPPPAMVTDAIKQFLDKSYGYQISDCVESIAVWLRRYGLLLEPEHIVPVHSVISAMHLSVEAFSRPGDKIMVFSPSYGPFFDIVRQSGRRVVEVELTAHQGVWHFSPSALDPSARMLLLCNPHNPTGKIWSSDELHALGAFCVKHNITILSDDVHSEFTHNVQRPYLPLATLSDAIANQTITFQSPNKTFNLAHIPAASYLFSLNPVMCSAIKRAVNKQHLYPGDVAMQALCAAYNTDNGRWLNAVKDELSQNRVHFHKRLAHESALLPVVSDGTFFAWLNLSSWIGDKQDNAATWLYQRTGIAANDGSTFNARGWVRLNLACPTDYVDDAASRLIQCVNSDC